MRKKRPIVLGIALLIAILLAIFAPKRDEEADTALSEPRRVARVTPQASPSSMRVLDTSKILVPRSLLVHPSPNVGSDLFAAHSWDPPPVATPTVVVAPMAPQLPFTFLGKKHENGIWEVYLDDGGRLLTIRQNDVVEGAYKVASIDPPILELIYVPLGQKQTLTIGDPE